MKAITTTDNNANTTINEEDVSTLISGERFGYYDSENEIYTVYDNDAIVLQRYDEQTFINCSTGERRNYHGNINRIDNGSYRFILQNNGKLNELWMRYNSTTSFIAGCLIDFKEAKITQKIENGTIEITLSFKDRSDESITQLVTLPYVDEIYIVFLQEENDDVFYASNCVTVRLVDRHPKDDENVVWTELNQLMYDYATYVPIKN